MEDRKFDPTRTAGPRVERPFSPIPVVTEFVGNLIEIAEPCKHCSLEFKPFLMNQALENSWNQMPIVTPYHHLNFTQIK